ncbi:nicotinate-nucleotide adenylyltransferase [Pseudoxanthomonas winnipegensis]|uniref:nicotinate-nucleotide adenylyltransferase n=1 Tax=Pseudoxanthomonas winnipegensis TaxID=2480810 RepID=UPI001038FC34|nr:nicotinate-nucleotide adenylyltransferase [Pseudoxanthomonas winnipegensis]TBV75036.1 nicotinate-nucleotide adenylyltransferase [Pseudoxanthomonas winnipegensis]
MGNREERGSLGSAVPSASPKQQRASDADASAFPESRIPIPESRIPNPESPLHVIYGGTFDPFHNGHLAIAQLAAAALAAPVTLVPAADPPHRPPPGANAPQRLAMLQAAVAGLPALRVDRRELDRPGHSYTVDTLRSLRDELGPQAPLVLLLGADSFLGLPGWHRWQELFALAHLVVAERAGSGLGELPAALAAQVQARWVQDPAALHAAPAGQVLRLHQPLQLESASEVRRRIVAGGDWQALVPPPVAAFIRAHGLYGMAGL